MYWKNGSIFPPRKLANPRSRFLNTNAAQGNGSWSRLLHGPATFCKNWPHVSHIKLMFGLLPTNWFVSTETHYIKCHESCKLDSTENLRSFERFHIKGVLTNKHLGIAYPICSDISKGFRQNSKPKLVGFFGNVSVQEAHELCLEFLKNVTSGCIFFTLCFYYVDFRIPPSALRNPSSKFDKGTKLPNF